MKTNTKIGWWVLAVVIVLVATWFAFRTPTAPSLPVAMAPTTSSTIAGAASTTPTSTVATTAGAGKKVPAMPTPVKYIYITVTAPVAGTQWVIGQENTITWNKPAGIAGQMYLVDANTGVTVGWVQESLGPNQTMLPWNLRGVYLSATSPVEKDVVPGKYFLKFTFASPEVPSVTSGVFSIIAATTTATL